MAESQTKRVWVRALGCQMNKLDGQLLLSQLAPLGYEPSGRQDDASADDESGGHLALAVIPHW